MGYFFFFQEMRTRKRNGWIHFCVFYYVPYFLVKIREKELNKVTVLKCSFCLDGNDGYCNNVIIIRALLEHLVLLDNERIFIEHDLSEFHVIRVAILCDLRLVIKI